MRYIFNCLIAFMITGGTAMSQLYFSEGFESGSTPSGWTQESLDTYGKLYSFNEGGGSICTEYDSEENVCLESVKFPISAFQGNYNALLFNPATETKRTRLITPNIDLSGAIKSELSFYYSNVPYGGDFEKLKVLARKSNLEDWVLLEHINTPSDDWDSLSLFIPDSLTSTTFSLAFEGETDWGHGLCIDSIVLIEKGIIPFQITNFEVVQPSSIYGITGAANVPLLGIRVNSFGNIGDLILNEISTTLIYDDIDDIDNVNAKLFVTENEYFVPDSLIASNVTVNNDIVLFENINHTFNFGESYLWVAFDILSDAIHRNKLDMILNESGVNVTLDLAGATFTDDFYIDGDSAISNVEDKTYKVPLTDIRPTESINPNGDIEIQQAIFFDDFEGDTMWSLSGDFEISYPMGLGGISGNPDPDVAFSGNKALGNDLTGTKGIYPGDYEFGVFSEAISPSMNLSYFKELKVVSKYYLNKYNHEQHFAYIDYSTNGGATWNLLKSFGISASFTWEELVLDLSASGLDRTDSLQLKFVMACFFNAPLYYQSGWNLDDFAVIGNYIEKDVSITKIIEPNNSCLTEDDNYVKVMVKNLAALDTPNEIPIGYSLDNGTSFVMDTIRQVIPVGDSLEYTFSSPINFPSGKTYNFKVATMVSDDEAMENDTAEIVLIKQPLIDQPYFEDFSQEQGLWFSYGDSAQWQWGNPAQFDMPFPPEDPMAWVTNLTGNYSKNSIEYVESPCFDFSNFGRGIVEYNYYVNTQNGVDGAKLQFSVDGGSSWTDLDTNDQGYSWEWYAYGVSSLSSPGWSGTMPTEEFSTARQLLPDSLQNYNSVKFRMKFASDASVESLGFAFDDFSVYPTPNDIGVNEITSHKDTCLNTMDETVYVSVKNFGFNPLRQNDTVIIGFDIDGTKQFQDSVFLDRDLPPMDTYISSIQPSVQLNDARTYNFRAYTLYEERKDLFPTENDTVLKVVETWPIPEILVPDTVLSYDFDSVYIDTFELNNNYTYKWDDGTTEIPHQVFAKGNYNVTVIDQGGNGCRNYDSVWVELFFYDIGLDSMLTPVSACEFPNPVNPTVRLRNFGNDTLKAGENIAIGFIVDGIEKTENFILSYDLLANQTLNYTYSTISADLSQEMLHELVFFTDYGTDTVPENDTVYDQAYTYGFPELTLEESRTVYAYSDTIDAGAGYASYSWSNGENTQQIEVTNTGTYSVNILDNNNCPDSDEIFVRLIIQDMQPVTIDNPGLGCTQNEQNLTVQIENNGNDTLVANDSIFVYYKFDGNSYVSDTMIVNENWYPDGLKTYSLNGVFVPNSAGNYSIGFVATQKGDLNTSNDTLIKAVTINDSPNVFINGIQQDTIETIEDAIFLNTSNEGTYLWSNNETGRNTIINQEGEVTLEVTDNAGCIGSTWVYLRFIEIDDVISNSLGEVSVYPNPAVNQIMIDVPNDLSGDLLMQIFSHDGRLLINEPLKKGSVRSHVLKVDKLMQGSYQVVITGEDGRYSGVLVIR